MCIRDRKREGRLRCFLGEQRNSKHKNCNKKKATSLHLKHPLGVYFQNFIEEEKLSQFLF